MEKVFVTEEMYERQSVVQAMRFEHTHWEKKDGEMVSALYVKTRSGDTESITQTSIHCYPSSQELRDLSHMFAAAADDMDAHAAFIKARDEAKAGESA